MSDFMAPPPQSDPPAAQPTPAAPAAGGASANPPVMPAPIVVKRGGGVKTFFLVVALLLFIGSVMVNLVLLSLTSSSFMIGGGGLQRDVIRPGKGSQIIAVHRVTGMIDATAAHRAETFVSQVMDDDDVKAVLIRVDSPGGGVSSCDRIYKAFKELKEEHNKPLIISMGRVAASGGYYISAPANEIVAEPTTITGSIGVIGQVMTFKGTMDKIGVKVKLLPSTQARAWKAAPNMFEDPADYQMAELQQIIDQMHKRFQDLVAAERKGTIKATTATNTYTDAAGKAFTVKETEPYNGRIFLADKALDLGLIDTIGYFDDAIDAAAKAAGLSKPKVVLYRRRPTFTEELGLGFQGVRVDSELLDEMQTPKIMMVWKVGE